jgi:hypothetical protein
MSNVAPGPMSRARGAATAAAVVALALLGSLQAAAASPTTLASHRAGYVLKLHSAQTGSGVESATGVMIYQWADVCDGWTVQQRFELAVDSDQGGSKVGSEYLTWEAKDGNRYRFRSRQFQNDQMVAEIVGEAEMPAGGGEGVAHFEKPAEGDVPLSPGTMFPTTHFLALMDEARSGARLYNSRVFDGTEEGGDQELNAVIAQPRRAAPKQDADPAVAALAGRKVWPMRFAFFDDSSVDGRPNYELGIHYFADGVADELRLDFGAYTVAGTLTKLERIPAPQC